MTLRPPAGMSLRPALPRDAAELADLFRAGIEELAQDDYAPEQRAAWAAAADDLPVFSARLAAGVTLVAVSGERIAGFATLKGNDTVDLLYTHPDFARKGVATFLCNALETLAQGRKSTHLKVDASDTAQLFFARRGYVPVQRNTVSAGDEWLANTSMRKELAAAEGGVQ